VTQRAAILVTGSRGFIGRHLVARLREEGAEVHEWNSDVRMLQRFPRPLQAVVHLAAVSDPDRFRLEPAEAFSVNVLGTLAVLELCAGMGAACILTSTCGVYRPCVDGVPIPESSATGPITPYGMSKLLAEQVAETSARRHLLSVTVLRLFNVYGTGQRKGFLIPEILSSLGSGQPPVLNNPYAVRDFVYVADVVEAIVLAITQVRSGYRVFNIGSGRGIPIIEAARVAGRIFQKAELVEKLPSPYTESEHRSDSYVADITQAMNALSWKPCYGLEDGLLAMKASASLPLVES